MESTNCKRCGGAGKNHRDAFTYTNSTDGKQTHYPERWDACFPCDGLGIVPAPNFGALLTAIKGRRGLRSKAPDHFGAANTLANRRAYYVWRLARFHGGQDVTLPMTAETLCHDDPFRPLLEKASEEVAKRVFGTDMAAAARWAPLLGNGSIPTERLPVSAQSGGPVVLDSNKPDYELPEMF